ncbi:hypothetical protein PoB_005860800 [Plakobranchus ocellatus]|uniref:Uncharacterized protein n=1 Tax=Plakobranchus ocellatus TaxID=259542 RepID=A0AAV4CKD0_9GAST|nr:hypothetical protein PoB_005860800 [Plakobranchus ocellatus]
MLSTRLNRHPSASADEGPEKLNIIDALVLARAHRPHRKATDCKGRPTLEATRLVMAYLKDWCRSYCVLPTNQLAFPLTNRATDVRPGCKTQRIAPTLRQDESRSRLGVLSYQRNRLFSNMYSQRITPNPRLNERCSRLDMLSHQKT